MFGRPHTCLEGHLLAPVSAAASSFSSFGVASLLLAAVAVDEAEHRTHACACVVSCVMSCVVYCVLCCVSENKKSTRNSRLTFFDNFGRRAKGEWSNAARGRGEGAMALFDTRGHNRLLSCNSHHNNDAKTFMSTATTTSTAAEPDSSSKGRTMLAHAYVDQS